MSIQGRTVLVAGGGIAGMAAARRRSARRGTRAGPDGAAGRSVRQEDPAWLYSAVRTLVTHGRPA